MRKKIILSILLFAAYSLLLTALVYAQTPSPAGIDLTVSPAVLELVAKPGDKIQEKIRVRNNQARPVSLGLDVKKIVTDEQNGNPRPIDLQKGDDFKSWIQFDPPSFTARPREWQDVLIT